MKVNLAALKQDCESLKAKIVQSPERFKGVSTTHLYNKMDLCFVSPGLLDI